MASWRFFLNNVEVEEPIGWDAIEFTAQRMDSHGIDQPFSTEISFYGKGAKLIKELYDTQFINAEIAFRIESDVKINGAFYEFNGYVNMALYSERNVCDTDSWEVTVGIIDDNFRELFKARENVDVDISTPKDVSGSVIDDIQYDNIRLHKSDVYLIAKAETRFTFSDLWVWNYIDGWSRNQFNDSRFASVLPLYWGASDFEGSFGKTFDPTGPPFTYSNAFFKNNSAFSRTFDFSATIEDSVLIFNGTSFTDCNTCDCLDGETVNVNITIYIVSSPYASFFDVTNQYVLYDSPLIPLSGSGGGGSFGSNIILSQQIVIPPFQIAICAVQWGSNGSIIPYTNYFPTPCVWTEFRAVIGLGDVCGTLTELNRGEYASFADTMLIENCFERIIYKLTGQQNKLISDTFSKDSNGCYWNNAITNGLKIRNAPSIESLEVSCFQQEDANQGAFKISFKKLFDELDKIFCLGWAFEWTGTEWKIRIETRDYFYQNIIYQEYNNVGQVQQSAMSNDIANTFLIGYSDKWKNIQVSGTWAIHTDRRYFVNNRAKRNGSTAELDLLSDIIAEGYAIEFSRRMQFYTESSGSSDRPNDYELFIIWLNRFTLSGSNVENTVFRIPQESGAYSFPPGTVSMPSNYIPASNSPLGGLYNIYHTPARVACRWWKVLGMHTYGLASQKLIYQVGQYQTTYSSTINGGQEKESCIEIFGGAIAENSDISASILNPDYQEFLFKPIQIEFEYPQSLCDFINLADNNPYGKVRLTSGSLTVSGYIQSIANKPEDTNGGTTSFVLLASNIADPTPPEPPIEEGPYNEAYNNAYL